MNKCWMIKEMQGGTAIRSCYKNRLSDRPVPPAGVTLWQCRKRNSISSKPLTLISEVSWVLQWGSELRDHPPILGLGWRRSGIFQPKPPRVLFVVGWRCVGCWCVGMCVCACQRLLLLVVWLSSISNSWFSYLLLFFLFCTTTYLPTKLTYLLTITYLLTYLLRCIHVASLSAK
jgi:hypothetical protein